jgi:hypothetical protein
MITLLVVLVVLVVVTAVSYRIVKRMIGRHLQTDAAQQQIIQNGIPAQATILDVWETGIVIRHKTQLSLRLNVMAPNQASYEVETQTIATPLEVVKLQPGHTISIHIDPTDLQNIVLPTGHNP